MTNDDNPYRDAPDGKLARLRYSISTLWEGFGNVDSVGLGIVINCGLAALGVVVFVATSGLLSYAGAVWAILNIAPVVQWVLGL